MHTKYTALNPQLYAYLLEHCSPFGSLLDELVGKTEEITGPFALMQIAQDQGAFMTLLVRIAGARRAIEIGTFTGYSALCIARGLGEQGRLLCCDVSEEWARTAREYWDRDGVSERIEVKIAPALETLAALPEQARFEFAFIDADKENYQAYYEALLARMDSGGLVLFDNVLWGGAVVDPARTDPETEAIRALNDALARDERVEVVMLALGDGLTIARKR